MTPLTVSSASRFAQRAALPILAAALMAPFVPFLFWASAHVLGNAGCDNPSAAYYYNYFAGHSRCHGIVPLWNPCIMLGTSFVGEGQASLFHPLSAFFILLPTGLAYNCVAAACVVLSGLFFYGYARALNLSRAASVCSALVWAFSSVFVSRLFAGHLPILLALPVLPLLPMLWEQWRARGAAWRLAALAVGYGTLQLAGYPLATYIFSLFFLFYVLGLSAPDWGTASGRRCEARAIAQLGVFVLLGVALGAVQLLPSADYAAVSFRKTSSLEFCGTFSFAPENLLTLIAPGFFGKMGGDGAPYWGRNYLWEMWMYLGILPLALAAAGAVAAPRRRRWVLLGCGAGALVVALGRHTPLFPLLYRFAPLFSTFRGSSKYSLITLFCLTTLSAYGFEALLAPRAIAKVSSQPPPPAEKGRRAKREGYGEGGPGRSRSRQENSRQERHSALAVGVAACGVIALLAGLLAAVLLPGHAAAGSNWQSLLRWVQAQGEAYAQPPNVLDRTVLNATAAQAGLWLARAAALAVLSGGLLLLAWRRAMPAPAKLAAALALLALDLGPFFAGNLAWFDEGLTRYPDAVEAPLLKALAPSHGALPARIFDPTARYANEAMRYGLSAIGGYAGNTLPRYNNFLNRSQGMPLETSQAGATIRDLPPAFRVLGLEYLVAPSGARTPPEWPEVAALSDGRRVLRFPGCPRVFLAADARRCAGADEALDYVLDPKADVVARPAVETDGALPEAAPLEPGEEATCSEFGPNRVALNVHAARPRLLVLTETLYKDWRVRVDGAPAPILPANYLFRGVQVPAGDSTVVFTIESRPFRAGLAITLAALSILAAAAFVLRSRARSAPRTPNNPES